MLQDFKKTLRAIRRDYFDLDRFGTVIEVIAAMAIGVTGIVPFFMPWPALPFLILGGVVSVAGGMVASTLAGKLDAQKREEAWVKDENGAQLHIVGPGLRVTTLANTQAIVSKLTRNLASSQTVPAEAQKKLAPWLRDAEEAAKEVQGWDIKGNPVVTISFLRDTFNAQGVKAPTPVATYGLHNPAAAPAASGAILVPKTIKLKGRQTP